MRCYWDGSKGKDDTESEWLTLAGYMAGDLFWGDFQRKWELMLRERYPIAPYIHMYELLAGKDPFERGASGWDESKIHNLIQDAVDLLQNLDKRSFCSFICSIDITARSKLVKAGYDIPQPEIICATICVGNAFGWYYDNFPNSIELAYIFWDRNEAFIREIKQRWLRDRTPRGKVATNLFWDLIEEMPEVDMDRHPPLQAADMIAWARSRSLSNRERTGRYLATVIGGVIPQTSTIFTEEAMRSRYFRSL